MTSPVNFPLLISQLPYVQQMQNVAHTHPEMYQTLAAQQAFAEHLRESKQVQQVEKGNDLNAVKDEENRKSPDRQKQPPAKKHLAPEPEPTPPPANPWAGNIINRKV